MYKKVEYEQETTAFLKLICGTRMNDKGTLLIKYLLGHVRVYSLQSLKQNHWLNSEAMDVIFDYVTATRSVTVSFSNIVVKNLFAHCSTEWFDNNRILIPVIHSSFWFSMGDYLKEKNVICLDSFHKTKKVDMFERVFFYYQWQFEKSIAKSGHYCNQTLSHLRMIEVAAVCT